MAFAPSWVTRCEWSPPKACVSRTKGNWNEDEVVLANPAENRKRIEAAVQVARTADAIVLAIGGSAATSREAWADNHLGDATTLELVGEQNELARALFALGKPVVTVLINGRPQAVVEVAEKSNALLEGWYLGQEGGTALADVLFGDANPGEVASDSAAVGWADSAHLQREAERASRVSVRFAGAAVSFWFWAVVHDVRHWGAAVVGGSDWQGRVGHCQR